MAKDKPKLSQKAKDAIAKGGIKKVVNENTTRQKAAIKRVPPPANPNTPPGVIK